jgi:hypothetical protein
VTLNAKRLLVRNGFHCFVAFQIIIGALYGGFYGTSSNFSWIEWVFVFSSIIFLALDYAARSFPVFSALTAFIIYMGLGFYIESRRGSIIWQDGRLLCVPNFFLIWATLIAITLTKSKEKSEGKGEPDASTNAN